MALLERRTARPPERWEPAREFDQVAERMRRILEETFGDARLISAAVAWSPFVDIEETDDAYVLELELPGVKREDVDIELMGNEIMISGEIKERERQGVVRRRTRRTGRFEYVATLPDHVDGDKVEAHLEGGVLMVRVPKSERAHRRKIEVKS
ncbi:MAG: Hsp20/alpha crystallin family protein [Gaiellaceae bacterium]